MQMRQTRITDKARAMRRQATAGARGGLLALAAAVATMGPAGPAVVPAHAVVSSATLQDYTAYPPFVDISGGGQTLPRFLLSMSRDEQLFYAAYDGLQDLDEDGQRDLTYKPDVAYYGYFDPDKCYGYRRNTASTRFGGGIVRTNTRNRFFDPVAFSPLDSLGAYTRDCSGVGNGRWSGNYLNWVTMTRLDLLRKVLYGGKRLVDEADITTGLGTGNEVILEGAIMPQDPHSFARVLNGAVIQQATPAPAGVDYLTSCRTALPRASLLADSSTWLFETFTTDPNTRYFSTVVFARGNFPFWDFVEASTGRPCLKGDLGLGDLAVDYPDIYAALGNAEGKTPVDFNAGTLDDRARIRQIYLGVDNLNSPSGAHDTMYHVQVQVCVANLINADNHENCKQYPGNAGYKPIGILQEYGEAGLAEFGLFTGSYFNHTTAGLLRKRLRAFDDEIESSGTFRDVDLSSLTSYPADGRIIWILDNLVISEYRLTTAPTDSNLAATGVYQSCGQPFLVPFLFRGCTGWGNPLGEILYESVAYLAGAPVLPAYDVDDIALVSTTSTNFGLRNATRMRNVSYGNNEALMTASNPGDPDCRPLNVLLINSGALNDDGDDLPTSRSFSSGNSLQFDRSEIEAATNDIGTQEGIAGGTYAVGFNGVAADTDYLCSPKTVNQLAAVDGLCPAGASRSGSYLMAGAAYYAHTTDLRTDLTGEQTVNVLALDLRPVLPEVRIPIGDPASATQSVLLQPAYINRLEIATGPSLIPNTVGHPDASVAGLVRPSVGRLIKFVVVRDHELQSDGTYSGLYMVGWEDSIAGTDFDHDILGTIGYVADPNANTIRVTTNIFSQSVGIGYHLFGFTIQGTTQDGFHAYSGHSADLTVYGRTRYSNPVAGVPSCGYDRGGVDLRGLDSSTPPVEQGCMASDAAVGHTFNVGGSTAQFLPTPLYYAAKYGGFKDSNNNQRPDLVEEWDTVDTLGNAGADGLPDNYIPVTNPANIRAYLQRVLVQGGVSQRTASGTAAALVANEREGLGAVFQALFEPERTDDLSGATPPSQTVRWLGTLQALFVDVNGLFREDSDQDGTLDDYQTDKVVQLFYDQAEGETRVRRFDSSQAETFESSSVETVDLPELNALWNAREQLERLADSPNIDAVQTNYSNQSNLAFRTRYILTWLEDPATANDIVDSSEVVPFLASTFTAANYGSLDVGPYSGTPPRTALQNAKALVNYLRGRAAVAGQRPRAVAYKSTDTSRVPQLLGDIVHSSPVAVAAPAEAYDLLANDNTYTNFRRRWAQRRQVVYVGANDGMLHAFNAGFYDAATDSFATTGSGGETAYVLGAELWAYVPRALHPYLKWYADPNYTHGYYVDAPPRVFDVKAFDADADHPDGWGTILVVGFRLGGGGALPVQVDTQSDGIGPANTDSDPADDRQFRSAFVVMDITNPEEPPSVIAELSDPQMGFTTARPVVVPVRGATPSDPDKWFLVLGSGPDQRSTGDVDATSNANLFVYDIAALVGSGGSARSVTPVSRIPVSTAVGQFVGGITVSDFDLDLRAEALYFGTVANFATPGGDLYRLHVGERDDASNWGSPAVLLDVGKSLFAEPTLAVDEDANEWVYVGSGRLLSDNDETTSATETLYGIIDPNDPFVDPGSTPLSRLQANLIDVSGARVLTDGQVDSAGNGVLDETFGNMRIRATMAGGWKRDYRSGSATTPAQRTLNASTLLGSVLFNTAFSPPATASTAACVSGGLGDSELLGLDFRSGLPQPQGVFGTQACAFAVCSDEVQEALGVYNLGQGLASLPSLHLGQPGEEVPGRLTVVVQQSTGEIQSVEAQGLQPADSGEVSWQEYLE